MQRTDEIEKAKLMLLEVLYRSVLSIQAHSKLSHLSKRMLQINEEKSSKKTICE